jgi:hypothetical protein
MCANIKGAPGSGVLFDFGCCGPELLLARRTGLRQFLQRRPKSLKHKGNGVNGASQSRLAELSNFHANYFKKKGRRF